MEPETINVFINDDRATWEAARDLIYKNKDKKFIVCCETEEDADMFVMDFIHAPATNFFTVVRVPASEFADKLGN